MNAEYIIVGAGLSGIVLAERLASIGKEVLMIEKKPHIGGTCYDCYNHEGLLIHQYGPHIFNTDSREVWDYVNRFSPFFLYHHRVVGVIDGQLVPIPFNLTSLHQLFPKAMAARLEEKLVGLYGYNVKVPIMKLREQQDQELQFLADYIYEKVFLHYTLKQWGMRPEEVGDGAMFRVPVHISWDDRYFQNAYQGIPKYGYTRMMEQMLLSDKIHCLTNTDYRRVLSIDEDGKTIRFLGNPFEGKVIFTARLDELFHHCYGALPYRTLDFRFETLDMKQYQPVCTVNYPNDYAFTRITEFKHLTRQEHSKTTIVKEFPAQYDPSRPELEPYYPIPMEKNQLLYQQYRKHAAACPNLVLSGRLADYRYYNMSDTIKNALRVFDEQLR